MAAALLKAGAAADAPMSGGEATTHDDAAWAGGVRAAHDLSYPPLFTGADDCAFKGWDPRAPVWRRPSSATAAHGAGVLDARAPPSRRRRRRDAADGGGVGGGRVRRRRLRRRPRVGRGGRGRRRVAPEVAPRGRRLAVVAAMGGGVVESYRVQAGRTGRRWREGHAAEAGGSSGATARRDDKGDARNLRGGAPAYLEHGSIAYGAD